MAHLVKSADKVGLFLALCLTLVMGFLHIGGIEELLGSREVSFLERARVETTKEYPKPASVCLDGGGEYLHVVGTERDDEYAFSTLCETQ